MKSADLFFSDIAQGGTSDKEYHLQLEPAPANHDFFLVNFQYGRRGGTLQTGTKTPNPVPLAQAQTVFDRLLKEKTGKGYQISSDGSMSAPITPAGAGNSAHETPCELLEEITQAEALGLILNDSYWLQDKRNGHRRMVRKDSSGEIVGINRRGLVVPVLPRLLAELKLIPLKTFLIDGELEGEKLTVFDLLDANGDIRSVPYERRFWTLANALGETERKFISGAALQYIRMVSTWFDPDEKADAYKSLQKDRAEGVVFKLASAPYRAGRNGQHKKFKFVKTLTAKVLAVGDTGKDSLCVGLLDQDNWVNVGRVTMIGKGTFRPGDLVEVRYLYATEGRKLYQPSLLGHRDDMTEADCTLRQMKFQQAVKE